MRFWTVIILLLNSWLILWAIQVAYNLFSDLEKDKEALYALYHIIASLIALVNILFILNGYMCRKPIIPF